MRTGIGYVISFIEEIMFIGIIVFLFCFVRYDLSFSDIVNNAVNMAGRIGCFSKYILISIAGYPILMIVSVLLQKSGLLYDGYYKEKSILMILASNIGNDIAFPFYLLKSIICIALGRRKNIDSVPGTILFFVIWLVIISFVVINVLLL